MYIKLPIGKIVNIKEELGIQRSFEILGLDLVSDFVYSHPPEFGLFFSNNNEILKGEHGYDRYIGFSRDKCTRDFYYPDSKRIVKLYNYCILNTDTLLVVDHVSFHIEMKR